MFEWLYLVHSQNGFNFGRNNWKFLVDFFYEIDFYLDLLSYFPN